MSRSLGLTPPFGPVSESLRAGIGVGPSKACVTCWREGPVSRTGVGLGPWSSVSSVK